LAVLLVQPQEQVLLVQPQGQVLLVQPRQLRWMQLLLVQLLLVLQWRQPLRELAPALQRKTPLLAPSRGVFAWAWP
jgi:hypothetical protein